MDLTDLTLDELKTLAKSIEGFTFAANIGEDNLRKKLDEYIKENPDCITASEGDTEIEELKNENADLREKVEDLEKENATLETKISDLKREIESLKDGKPEVEVIEEVVVEPKENGMVDIKSIHRGEITTKFGVLDFGTEGKIEVELEVAEYLIKMNGYNAC